MTQAASPLSLLKDPSLLKTDGLINGQWVAGASRFEVLDPATGHKLADVANLGPADAEAAIAAVEPSVLCPMSGGAATVVPLYSAPNE